MVARGRPFGRGGSWGSMHRRTRRPLALVWIPLLGFAGVLSACGSSSPSGGGTTSVVATHMVPGVAVLSGIDCPAANRCVAVGATMANGQGVVVTLSGDTPGKPRVVAGSKELTAVSCTSTSSCEAVGVGGGHGVTSEVTDGAPAPGERVLDMSTLDTVSCSGSACYGGGRSVSVGAVASGPTAVLAIPGTTSVNGIDCSEPTSCEAIASTSNGKYNGVLFSLNEGRAGTLQVVPPATATFTALACPVASKCVAVGQGAFRVGSRVSDQAVVVGIQSGSPEHLVHIHGSSAVTLEAIACGTSSTCVAVGSAGAASSAGIGGTSSLSRGAFVDVTEGSPGEVRTIPGQALQLNGIACPTSTQCWAVGENPAKKIAVVVSLSSN